MFTRKIKPEVIADRLARALLPSGVEYFASYFAAVLPDELEQERLTLSMMLYPVIASYSTILYTKDRKLKEDLTHAHEIYLNRILDQDQIVRLGDYIIWRIEREVIARELRERDALILVASDFDNYQIRYGMLIRMIVNMRQQTYFSDMDIGMSQGRDTEQGLMLSWKSLGTTFTRQILSIDPAKDNLSQSDRGRFLASIEHGSRLQGYGYFQIVDIIKSL